MLESLVADLIVLFICYPVLYALAPSWFESTVEMMLRYWRWAGRLLIAFVVGVMGND